MRFHVYIGVIFFALLFLYQLSFHFIKIQRGKQNRKHNSETYTLKCQNQRASLQIIITCSKISYYKLCFKHLTVVTKLLVRRFHYKRLLFFAIKYHVCQVFTRVDKKEANNFQFFQVVSQNFGRLQLCSLSIFQKKFQSLLATSVKH